MIVLYLDFEIGIELLAELAFRALYCHYISIYLDCHAGRYFNRGFTYS